ncbi:MAG: sulfatase-like hydrolase/transferase, partial [Blastocatellia bacterium]
MKKPNVFWISIDSLRRDFLSIYNRHAMRSTYLDEIAEQGCIFEDAFPGGNWTIPSHATMLTGLDATSHMIWGWEHRFAPETETAFDLFRRAGYTTGCFAIPELRSLFSSPQIDYQGSADHPALFRCLDSQEPFFVFWHTYNVHYPYGMKAPSYFDFRTQDIDYDAGGPTMTYLRHLVVSERVDLITDSYRSEVQKVARFIKTVAGKLRSLGKLENTYFILTSDHGEAWRINGMFHCNFLEEVLRVPLAIV